jgi:hypothetical protein
MTALHQMGHDSENLLRDQGLSAFHGAILSPVNYQLDKTLAQIKACREMAEFRVIFDPQLYVPNSERGQLTTWSYFPTDVDSADSTSEIWWDGVTAKLAEQVVQMPIDAVCSPTMVPRTYENDYFELTVKSCELLSDRLSGSDVKVIQTAVVGMPDLTMKGRPLSIASILTGAPTDEIFLVLVGNTEPRRELKDPEELKGAMKLIRALEDAGVRVTVGFVSSDVLLWKHAGATSCATGKFFNLRRFTKARFEEPTGGGGQLSYWFEEALLAFLRESDILRALKAGLISDASKRNPFGRDIVGQLAEFPGAAWLAKSWRQYLWWFADVIARIETGKLEVPVLLKQAEETWQEIEDKILMEEPSNNGSWLRQWRRAVIEFQE